MIHVYTGDGKGKTTAAVGLALRALGWGKRVCLIRFLKGERISGEDKILGKIRSCRIARCGRGRLLRKETIGPIDRREAEKGLDLARAVLEGREADVVILDELAVAVHFGLLPAAEVEKLARNCPRRIELVITGRRCPPSIIRLADYASDVRELRHPYRQGTKGRRGIEY
jgi:cob(I)alamin adenosyltransferase